LAVFVGSVWVGAAGDQQSGEFRLAAVDGAAEWGFAFGVAGFDVGAGVEEESGEGDVAAAGGHVEWGAADRAAGVIDASAVLKEECGDGDAVGGGNGWREGVGRAIEGTVAEGGFRVGIGTMFEEEPNAGEIPAGDGFAKQGVADRGGSGEVGIFDESGV